MLKSAAALSLLLSLIGTAWSDCPTPAQLASRFKIDPSNPSVVYDASSNVTWSRCTVGQVWNGSACAGYSEVLPWAEAVAYQVNGWRLPTSKELSSLLDMCSSPRIDKAIFEGSYTHGGSMGYWTNEGSETVAATVNFDKGTVESVPGFHTHAVRLVREGALSLGNKQVGAN